MIKPHPEGGGANGVPKKGPLCWGPWKSGAQIWDPILGPDLGPDLGPKFGAPNWVQFGAQGRAPQMPVLRRESAALGSKLGSILGPKSGPQIWGPKVWAPNLTQIWDPNLGPKFGPKLGTQIWAQIWSQNWAPNLGPTFLGTLFWAPCLGILVWDP